MKLVLVSLSLFAASVMFAADSFPTWYWELSSFSIPFRSSPCSSGAACSSALVSAAIVTETDSERFEDALPSRGLFGKEWPAGVQIDASRFIEFSITPSGSTPLYIGYVQIPLFRESIDAWNRGESGPRRWVLRWSIDNFQNNIGSEFDMSGNNDRSEAVYRVDLWHQPPITEAVTFRLYGYDAPSPQGSGGVVVVTHKLYIAAGTRPPLIGISPRILTLDLSIPTCSIEFEGGYGDTYGLERSSDLKTWVPAGVSDKTVTNIENSEWFFSIPIPANSARSFFRVIERQSEGRKFVLPQH